MKCKMIWYQPTPDSILLKGGGTLEPENQKFFVKVPESAILTVHHIETALELFEQEKKFTFEIFTPYDDKTQLWPLRDSIQICRFPETAYLHYKIEKILNTNDHDNVLTVINNKSDDINTKYNNINRNNINNNDNKQNINRNNINKNQTNINEKGINDKNTNKNKEKLPKTQEEIDKQMKKALFTYHKNGKDFTVLNKSRMNIKQRQWIDKQDRKIQVKAFKPVAGLTC